MFKTIFVVMDEKDIKYEVKCFRCHIFRQYQTGHIRCATIFEAKMALELIYKS